MKEYADKAAANFINGYNCAQSIALAFSDYIDMDKELLLKVISPFGGGMGRLREVCGAISGMFFVTGWLYGYNTPADLQAKTELYKRVQELAEEFKKTYGSIVCRELIGVKGASSYVPEKRTAEYYKTRPCTRIIAGAADILSDYIASHPIKDKPQ